MPNDSSPLNENTDAMDFGVGLINKIPKRQSEFYNHPLGS
jgi:hypothetical protein